MSFPVDVLFILQLDKNWKKSAWSQLNTILFVAKEMHRKPIVLSRRAANQKKAGLKEGWKELTNLVYNERLCQDSVLVNKDFFFTSHAKLL